MKQQESVKTLANVASQSSPDVTLFQAVLDALPSHIAILDASGTILLVNAAWRGFGAANDLALSDGGVGANYLEACESAVAAGDTDAVSIVRGMRAVLAEERETYTFDYPCHAPHERRWFAFRVARLAIAGESRFLVSHENVTARHLAEETARANRARYRAVFSSVGDAILLADEHGRILDANAATEALLGYTRDELATHSLARLTAPGSSPSTTDLHTLLANGARRDELELLHKQGHAIPVEALITAAEVPQGRIYLAAIRDMTQHREAEARLREEREALTIINQVGRMLSAELNLDALLQEVTDAATNLTGAALGAFLHRTPGEDKAPFTLYTLSGAGATVRDVETIVPGTDGLASLFIGDSVVRCADVRQDPRYAAAPPSLGFPAAHTPIVSFLAVPVVGRHGDVLGGLIFTSPEPGAFPERAEIIATGLAAQAAIAIENARLFRQVQQELAARESAEAAKVHLVDAMAHDLGGPLTVIRGQGQLLRRRMRRGDLAADRLETALDAMDQAVERARLLISDMTDVARLESDRPLELDRAPVNLGTLTGTAVASFEGSSTRVALRMEQCPEPVIGWWDANRIIRVLENLLANAIKYSPAGGVVTAQVTRQGEGPTAVGMVTISDQGVGIPEDDLPHIFERFHRGRNVQGRIAGTGLGLWGSRRIVERHQGAITISSVEGEGTTISVSLPLTPGDDPAYLPESSATTGANASITGSTTTMLETP